MRAPPHWKIVCLLCLFWVGCPQGGDLHSCQDDFDCGDPSLVCHERADNDGVCAPACVADDDQSCAKVAPDAVCFLNARCAPESLSCWENFECGADGARCQPEGDADGVCLQEDLALPSDRSYSLRDILRVR